MAMRILITGGSGYVGARLSQELARSGHKVTPLCFPAQPEDRQWLDLMEEVIYGDITDMAVVDRLANGGYDALIHLVSLDHRQSEAEPRTVSKVNVQPLWDLLHSFGAKSSLKRCVYFSTAQVYGRTSAQVITEDTSVAPVNAYGLTHYMCEEICRYYGRKGPMECICVRLSNSYGQPVFADANCWWLVVNDLCRQAVANGEIRLLSDGSPQRDFIHYSDVAKAIATILSAQKLTHHTYNLCSGRTYTILELADMVRDCFFSRTGRRISIVTSLKRFDGPVTQEAVSRTVWDNSRLQELGFEPTMNLSAGIGSLFDYLEQEMRI